MHIQAIKAGLMEIGDLFVVNKADRDGAGKTVSEILFMLQMNSDARRLDGWGDSRGRVCGNQAEGSRRGLLTILEHKHYLEDRGKDRLKDLERNRALSQFMDLFRKGSLREL